MRNTQLSRVLTYFTLLLITVGLVSCGSVSSTKRLSGLVTDIPIGIIDGVPLTINIAFPEKRSQKPRPALLIIHGGGFVSGNKDSKNNQIQKATRLGFVAASAMYRLAPEYKFPAQLDDIKLAIRHLKANAEAYNIDPDRILLSGASAGGYLAVMAGVTGNAEGFSDYGLYPGVDSRVHAVAAQSAPIGDFRLSKYDDSPMLERLAGSDPKATTQVRAAMSPARYLDAGDPPFFLSHGDQDSVVPVDMSREFVAELDKIEHNVEYYEVKGGEHSLKKSTPEGAQVVYQRYLAFLVKWAK
ncbi:alpha/beta hydrolase [Gilvimarinus sp. DA14]|uniref:alpha/beta hydrolase n=1 Tax=Gilvimarinus sp. DA14 TaxID=2956798 RepID=UPI0020B7C28B|nr:alpha/beta hydrolase [Gilvimarinus sp. DA14]UTF60661.1 alpha/beta hydrolase [Gilvimarinus sp. DA14]